MRAQESSKFGVSARAHHGRRRRRASSDSEQHAAVSELVITMFALEGHAQRIRPKHVALRSVKCQFDTGVGSVIVSQGWYHKTCATI